MEIKSITQRGLNVDKYTGIETENVVLFSILSFCVVMLYSSTTISTEAARVPQITLAITAILCMIGIVHNYTRFSLPDVFVDKQEEQLFELHPRSMMPTALWSILFVFSLTFVGFFSSIFAFIFLYIYVNDTSLSGISRPITSLIWASASTGFLYYLLVDLMRVSAMYDLGFLI